MDIECVNKVIENPVGTYDVILMDIQMPKMDGYKATCEIRNLQDKAKACVPILAITANAFEEDKKKAIDAGMDGHIAKPINIEDLFIVLTDIINKPQKLESISFTLRNEEGLSFVEESQVRMK